VTNTRLGRALGKRSTSVDTEKMLLSRSFAAALVFAALATSACSTYHDQLARGQRAFEQNEHDRSLVILQDLEADLTRMTSSEQASYAYLRGMSDYRIGYQSDARHWLSLAKAYEDGSPGVLPADWKARTNEALTELNGIVYSHGTTALSTARREGDEKPDTTKGPGNSSSDEEKKGESSSSHSK